MNNTLDHEILRCAQDDGGTDQDDGGAVQGDRSATQDGANSAQDRDEVMDHLSAI